MSVSAGTTSDDLSLAFEGGDNFVQRMNALSVAKAANEKALADLNIGQAIKSALDQAQASNVEAGKVLAAARTQAAQIISDATAKATAIIDDANAKQSEALVQAAKAKSDSETYVALAKTNIDLLTSRAKAAADESEKIKQQNQSIQDALNTKLVEAQEETDKAKAAAEKHAGIVTKLKDAITAAGA